MQKKIRVTIWNENIHEREDSPMGEVIRKFYPDGIHNYLKIALAHDEFEIRAVSLDMPEQGLPDEVLNSTDVLLWWGHIAHAQVSDELVDRIQKRILLGMGLIVLHSGHLSKIFRRMLGTACRLHWRDIGEKERVWTVATGHPIVDGVPESFTLPNSEMYGERFDIPDDGKVIFMSWYEGGNVFRSGMLFQRDAGKIFYFSPGHEAYPIYHDPNIRRVLTNAVRFVNPVRVLDDRVTPMPESPEPIRTPNPLKDIALGDFHKTR